MAEMQMPSTTSALAVRYRNWLLASGAVLVAIYILPLFVPPATIVADLDLAQRPDFGPRLFPGVPFAWVALRLAALGAGVIALAAALGWHPATSPPMLPPTGALQPRRPALLRLALLVALLLGIIAIAAPYLPARIDLLFGCLTALPLLLTAAAYGRESPRPIPHNVYVSAGIIVVWALWRWWSGWGDGRAATAVDTWPFFESFADAVANGRPLLGIRFEPAAPDLIHVLVGAPILDLLGADATLAWVRAWGFVWLGIAATATHTLAARIAGPAAAPVAVAALLFAPFTLHDAIVSSPFCVIIALLSLLFLAFHSWITRNSPVALVGLATVGGLASAFGHSAIPTALIGVVTIVTLIRRRHVVARRPLVVAVLTGAALAYPSLPSSADFREIQSFYIDRFHPWSFTEAWLFGQRSLLRDFPDPTLAEDGLSRPDTAFPWLLVNQGEIVLGAVIAPLAIARNALRLCGDVMLEPISIVLGLLGIVLLASRRATGIDARLLLTFTLISLLPALTTAYDRPSLLRSLGIIPAWSLLAAVAFARLTMAFRSYPLALTIAASASIAISGGFLFDVTNPRILAQSWVAIALDSVTDEDKTESALLDNAGDKRHNWMFVDFIAAQVPRQPIDVVEYSAADSLAARISTRPLSQVFWSPALEWEFQPSAAICQVFPAGRVFTIDDPAGLSRTWAAAADEAWEPAVARQRWRVEASCLATPHAGLTRDR